MGGKAVQEPGTPWVGLNIPNNDPHGNGDFPIGAFGQLAEGLGFDSLWAGDHLVFNTPWVDSTIALASLSASTKTIGLGYSVLLAALRHPVVMAKQIASLQVVSGNRLRLGVGVGGENPVEWAAAGVPMAERAVRTDAFLDALPGMMAARPLQIGPPYGVDVPPMLPAVPMPPLLIGGRSDWALARAVKYRAAWLGMWVDPARVRKSRDKLAELRANPDDPISEIDLVVFVCPGKDKETAERDAREYVEQLYAMPYDKVRRWVLAGRADVIAEGLSELRSAGASGFVLAILSSDTRSVLGEIADAVTAAW